MQKQLQILTKEWSYLFLHLVLLSTCTFSMFGNNNNK